MASVAELTQQIINLDQALQTANGRMDALQAELAVVKGSGGQGGNRYNKSLIMDGKKLYPEALKDGENFIKWSESFLRWLKCESPDLKALFVHAGKSKHPIALSQCPQQWKEYVTFIYNHLQKLILDVE